MKTADNVTAIQTERLVLRPILQEDARAALEIFSDARTMEYWSNEPITTLAEAETLIQKDIEWAALDSTRAWAITLAGTDLYMGKITLFQINQQNRRGEIGYLLGRKHWGKGYMTEAMASVLAHAFDVLKLHRIEVDTDPENARSLALLERFGFAREGLFEDRWYVHGAWHDSVMLALLENNYRKNSPADLS